LDVPLELHDVGAGEVDVDPGDVVQKTSFADPGLVAVERLDVGYGCKKILFLFLFPRISLV
jgi:hypothetical protein